MIDEAGPSLGRIDFFNYGEAFLHKRAVEMCEYIKTKFPHIYLYTSTNGLAFTEEKVRQLARIGHRRSDVLDRRLVAGELRAGTASAATSTRRSPTCAPCSTRARRRAATLPFVNWRYILFKWNDSDEEMGRAREMAKEIGVDRLCWEITDHPEDSFSRRFAPDAPDYERIRHEIWDNSGLGNAIPGATPRAEIDVPHRAAGSAVHDAAPATPVTLTARVKNLSGRPFRAQASYGRRLVRLGAQLTDERRRP